MLTGGAAVPLVPLVINTAAPPLPTVARCVAARGARWAPRSARRPEVGRVLVAASGGLSHWLPSNDPRDPCDARRAPDVGDPRPAATSTPSPPPASRGCARWAATRTRGWTAEWDRWFLDRLAAGDLAAVAALGDARLQEEAGSGPTRCAPGSAGLAAVGRAAACGRPTSRCRSGSPGWASGRRSLPYGPGARKSAAMSESFPLHERVSAAQVDAGRGGGRHAHRGSEPVRAHHGRRAGHRQRSDDLAERPEDRRADAADARRCPPRGRTRSRARAPRAISSRIASGSVRVRPVRRAARPPARRRPRPRPSGRGWPGRGWSSRPVSGRRPA